MSKDYEILQKFDYIETLEIRANHAPVYFHHPNRLLRAAEDEVDAIEKEDKDSAAVVDGSAVSFVAGVQGKVRTDVLNSTLLAQLAANKYADRFTDVMNWYKKYTEVLGKLGWVMQDFNFQRQGSSSVTLDLNSVVIGILGGLVASNGIAIITAVMQSLKDSSSEGALTFNLNSSYKDNANFQLGHVSQSQDGLVAMSAAALEIHTSTHESGWWLWKVNTASASVQAASQTMTLDLDIYDQVRDIVRKKLGLSAGEYIKDLDI